MTYVFMDLEAVPEKNQMISFGATYEDKTFYSLSKTDNLEDLTIQIEQLTKITQKDLEMAPSVNEVIENFINWLPSEYKILVYGNYDREIMRSNLVRSGNDKVRDILQNMIDVSKISTKVTFGTKKVMGLLKVAQTLNIADSQNHNALDDAILLKKVFVFYQKKSEQELIRSYFTGRYNDLKHQYNSGVNNTFSNVFKKNPECSMEEFSVQSRIIFYELSTLTDIIRIFKNDFTIKIRKLVEETFNV